MDKSTLKATVEEALGLAESDYTDESWAALVAARDAAQTVLDDDAATAEQVETAQNALRDAIDGLEKKPVDPDRTEPDPNPDPDPTPDPDPDPAPTPSRVPVPATVPARATVPVPATVPPVPAATARPPAAS